MENFILANQIFLKKLMKRLNKIIYQIRSDIEYILSYFNFGPMYAYKVNTNKYSEQLKIKLNKQTYIYNHYFGDKTVRMSDYIFVIAGNSNHNYWSENEVLLVNPNYDRLRRNDYVVLSNDKDELRIAKVMHPGWPNLPDLFDGNEMIGIDHWVVGKIEYEHLNKTQN